MSTCQAFQFVGLNDYMIAVKQTIKFL